MKNVMPHLMSRYFHNKGPSCKGLQPVFFALVCALVTPVTIQAFVLPQGRFMAVSYYVGLPGISATFNDDRARVSIGDAFKTPLTGGQLATFDSDAQTLFDELNALGTNDQGQRYGDLIDLGVLSIDVVADIDILILGAGYGVTDYLSIFFIVPYQWSHVRVTGTVTGTNNAEAIKKELGGLAPAAVRDGLDQMSALNFNAFVDAVKSAGYADPQQYEGSEWRDSLIVLRFETALRNALSAGSYIFFKLPTGKVADPNQLSAIASGGGNWGLELYPEIVFQPNPFVDFSFEGVYRYTLPVEIAMRVPLSESDLLPGPDRTQIGTYQHGTTYGANVHAKYYPDQSAAFAVGCGYAFEFKTGDRYDKRREDDGYVHKLRIVAQYNGFELYLSERFIYAPFLVQFSYEHPIAGRNFRVMPRVEGNVVLAF